MNIHEAVFLPIAAFVYCNGNHGFIETTASMLTNFCKAIKTTKYASRMLQSACRPNCDDGGHLAFEKIDKSPQFSNCLTDCHEI